MAPVDEPVFIAAPALPPGSRHALVITTSMYLDLRLRRLRSPVKDAEDLAVVLADPSIGGFEVSTLIDQTESRIRREIAAFLAERGSDETVLVYLSCHGIQDARGRLLFAATDTDTRYPHATAVRASELLDELDECRARRQILILDCCFSGSFSDNKGGGRGELDLERQLRGHSRGREVLTASRGFEYSFEGEPLDGSVTGSVFTTGLVEGLRTGAADTDKNGQITAEDAYRYAFAHVQAALVPQTPQRWLFGGEGTKIVLARSVSGRVVIPARLPADLADNLESRYPGVRIGAVNEIADWLLDPDPARQLAARRALEAVVDNDVRKVSDVARGYLMPFQPPPAGGTIEVRIPSAPVTTSPSVEPNELSLAAAMQLAYEEGEAFGDAVAGDAPVLWQAAVMARKPRMPRDLEASLLQASHIPIDFLLKDDVRHALRRGFWDAMERARDEEQARRVLPLG
jgi:hypothetical protein